jgi:protein SCO1/2
MISMRRGPGPIIAVSLLALALSVYVAHRRDAVVGARGGGAFELVDSSGRSVTDRDFRGKWLLLFFGYTHCPDVCPTTLSDIAETLTRLGPLADQVQPLFITVDPERDTPQVLAEYTAAIDQRIVGLTGTPQQIAAAAKTYRIFYAKRPAGDDYSMDHTAIIHVVRPNGHYASSFLTTDGPLQMASRLREMIAGSPSAATDRQSAG